MEKLAEIDDVDHHHASATNFECAAGCGCWARFIDYEHLISKSRNVPPSVQCVRDGVACLLQYIMLINQFEQRSQIDSGRSLVR